MNGDPIVRDDWARAFEGMGMHAIRCAGPACTSCPLLQGRGCPLHDDADVAIYEEGLLGASLLPALVHRPPPLPIGFAQDRIRADGRHQPHITRIFSEGRLRDGGFALLGR